MTIQNCPASDVGLADRLRERTRVLHRQAEHSGIIRELLLGRASRYGYALFLRNLLPAYRQLELSLEQHGRTPGVRDFARPEVYRAKAMASDLAALYDPSWSRALALLPAGARYARRIETAAMGDGARLIGHAYVRYLGDLNGGRVVERRLMLSLGLGTESLAFYAYPAIADPVAYRTEFRAKFDRAAAEILDPEAVLDEASVAFQLNIELAEEVQAVTG